MANAPTVITNATNETPRIGGVLDGLKFFVLQRVPRRTGLLRDIEANGGQLVKLETQCDYAIADHLRRDAPGGSYSYTFIDSAIKEGRLPDPAHHATGGTLRSERPVGSVIPGKNTRTSFTPEDDKDLWEFVEEAKQDGASVKGNALYKHLEKVNPRHTWQSWRDRYITRLLDNPPPPGARAPMATMVLPTSPSGVSDTTTEWAPPQQATAALNRKRKVKVVEKAANLEHERSAPPEQSTAQPVSAHTKISDYDLALLLEESEYIEDTPRSVWGQAWSVFEQAHPHHTAEEWISLYLTHARPLHRKRSREAAGVRYNRTGDQDDTEPEGMAQNDKRTGNGPGGPRGKLAFRSTSSTANVQKRKRTSPASSPPQACAASHKRQKSGSDRKDASADHDSMLTSDLNREAEQQVHIEADAALRRDPTIEALLSDALLTSDANMAADRQLSAEAVAHDSNDKELVEGDGIETLGRPVGIGQPTAVKRIKANSIRRVDVDTHTRRLAEQSDRDLLASEANRGADKQLRQIMLDDKSEVESQLDADDNGLAAKNNRSEAQGTSATSGHSVLSQHSLTEANLASQQAQHKPYTPRATDLPPDEEEKDQSDFIDYLQTALSKKKASHGNDGATVARAHSNGLDLDHRPPNLRQTRAPSKADGGKRAPAAAAPQLKPAENIYKVAEEPDLEQDLPMSSQQELDDALDESLKWPASPQQNRSRQRNQSQTFETQITNSPLGSTMFEHIGLAAPDFRLTSQSMLSQHDEDGDNTQVKPVLSFQQPRPSSKASMREHENEHGNDASTRERSTMLNSSLLEDDENEGDYEEGSDDAADGKEATIHQETYIADGDVDLTVVEPDGGFPAPESPASEPMVDSSKRANGTRTPSDEPIIISSTNPSSSPYQSPVDGEASMGLKQISTSVAKQALETQDIMNAETQLPDLSMPEPSLPDDDSESPAGRTAPAATRDQSVGAEKADTGEPTTNMDTWVLSMKARGLSDKAISKALRCTSYRPHLAQLVLFEEKRGNGLPDDHPGIWSKLEDEILEGSDARRLRRLDEKHGSAECSARLDFLSQWREMFPAKS